MTLTGLVWDSFRFRLRSHLGTLAGVVAASFLLGLSGALIVRAVWRRKAAPA